MVKILWHRTVVRDGWHNLGTDLCFWRGFYWLTYCRRSAHTSVDGAIVVLRSIDLERWQEIAFINTEGDDRDPKLLPVGDRLFLYFSTWVKPYEENRGLRESYGNSGVISYVSISEDGATWSKPVQVYEENYWLWRPRFYDGVFYCTEKGGWLLTSKDGLKWIKKSHIPREKDKFLRSVNHRPCPAFNEADIIFRPSGELWCISRTKYREPDNSLFYFSKPPYEDWECVDLKTRIHCPVFCESGGKVYVAGRRNPSAPWISQSTPAGNTGIWLVEKGKVIPVLALPSDGDAAYPGLISLKPVKLLISYYSQHAYRSGVICGLTPHSADIYTAEIAIE